MAMPKKKKVDEQKLKNDANAEKRKNEELVRKLPSNVEGPIMVDGETYFSRADRLELMLLQEKVQHSETKLKKLKADLDRHEAQYLYQRQRTAEVMSALEIERAKSTEMLRKYHKDIEQVYGVCVGDITFDTVTGIIKVLPEKE